jgi:hypothetical protein
LTSKALQEALRPRAEGNTRQNLHTCRKGPLLLRHGGPCEQCEAAKYLTKVFFGPRECQKGVPHLYDGPVISEASGLWSSKTCSRCGRLAITDTVWE